MCMVLVIYLTRNHQQYSPLLVAKSETINLSCRGHFVDASGQWEMTLHCNIVCHWLGACTKCLMPWAGYHQLWDIGKLRKYKYKLARKLYDKNKWPVNITNPIIFQFFIHITSFVVAILVKFNCFTSPFVSNFEAKSVVPELTTRDSEHCWWSLLNW